MITIARIINAWRDAEQFEKPTEDRSKMWHLLIWPQYGFAIFSLFCYGEFIESHSLVAIFLGIDTGFSWLAFEWFLKFFRAGYK